MVQANDIRARRLELYDLVMKNRIPEFLGRLMDLLKDLPDPGTSVGNADAARMHEAILVSYSWTELDERVTKDMISDDEASRRREKILRRALLLVDQAMLSKAS